MTALCGGGLYLHLTYTGISTYSGFCVAPGGNKSFNHAAIEHRGNMWVLHFSDGSTIETDFKCMVSLDNTGNPA